MNDQADDDVSGVTGFENAVHSMGMAAPAPGFTARWKVYAAARKYEQEAVRRFTLKAAAILVCLLVLNIFFFLCMFFIPAVSSTYLNFVPEFTASAAAIGIALREGLQVFRAPAALIAGLVFTCLIVIGGYRLVNGVAVRALAKKGVSTNVEIH